MAPMVRLFSRPSLPSLVVLVCAASVSLNLFFVYSTRHHGHNIRELEKYDSSKLYLDQRDSKEVKDVPIANPSDVRGSSEVESYRVEQAVLSYKERRHPEQEHRLPDQGHPLPDEERKMPDQGHPLPDQVHQMPEQVRQVPDQERQHPEQVRQVPDQERQHPEQVRQVPDQERQHPEQVRQVPDQERQHPEQVRQVPDQERQEPEQVRQHPEKERRLRDKENPLPVSKLGQLEQAESLEQAKTFEKPNRLKRSKKPDKDKTLEKSKMRDKISALPPCPNNPAGLEGQLKAVTTDIEPQEIISTFTSLKNGGRLRPSDCLARERVAIIFPYRNRWQHLHITLFNLIPFLMRQKVDATFFVIEQDSTSTFNRGALLNIGFLEAEKISPFDCYIFHDVDLIPLNDHNMYRCGDQPRHFASAMNKNGFRLMYDTFFGGVVGFSKKQYKLINGNSNIYFGWGGEDDDLWQRVYNKNMTVARDDDVTSRYLMIKHTRDEGNEKNSERKRILRTAIRRQDVEGLRTTVYDVLSLEVRPLYTWIKVSLDLIATLKTAPSYTRHDMWKFVKMWRLQQKELEKKRLEVDEDGKDT